MAKKRRKHQQEKEEKVYKPPTFDKKEFMETEIDVAKGTIIAVIFAIPMAVAAFFTMDISGYVGLFIGLGGIGLIVYLLPMLGVEVRGYKITHWLGVISSYFFLFVAIWVVLCNPPFSDRASPDISNVRVDWVGDGNFTLVSILDNTIDIPGTVNLTIQADITDNVELNVNTVFISAGGDNIPTMSNLNQAEVYIFEYVMLNAQEGLSIVISASDVGGRSSSFSFDLI